MDGTAEVRGSATARVRVRRARRGDAAAITHLAERLAEAVRDPPPAITADRLRRDGFGPGRWFECQVACVGEEIVGYALYCRTYEAHTGGRRLFIGDLIVSERMRGRGVGRRLLGAVARRARALGCPVVSLEVWQENHGAKRFFERLGARHGTEVSVMMLEAAALERLAEVR